MLRNPFQANVVPTRALRFLLFGVTATLNASTIGVAVNGICDAGSCPAAALSLNSSASLSADFTVTLADGDRYLVNGSFSGSNDSNGGGFSASHDFEVTYEGNAHGGASAADTVAVEGYYSFATTLATVGEGRGVIGAFGPTIAPSSSASSCLNGAIACLGPFTPPGEFLQFSGGFSLNSSGGEFVYDPTWTSNFGAGSAVGSYIIWGPSAPPPPPPPSAPEPRFLLPVGISALAVFAFRKKGAAPLTVVP
jgi:hypothetical protein